MPLTGNQPSFEEIVDAYHPSLYQFALRLTGSVADACDLTQETFYRYATKGHQLRDPAKLKPWLFTTLHREFLQSRRRQACFPTVDIADTELPATAPCVANQLDAQTILECFQQLDELYRVPLALFYLDNLAYRDIAEILGVPIGTVQSRIARAKVQLAARLHTRHARHE